MRRLASVLVVLVAIGAGALLVQQVRFRSAEVRWGERVEAALDSAAAAREVRDSAIAESARLQETVSEMKVALEERGRRTREDVRAVREVVVPDPCAPFVVWRDRLIDELVAEADEWRQALEIQEAATTELRRAHDALAVSHDRLEALLESRPRPRSRWLPRTGVGAFAGVTFDGRPAMGVGFTLSWEVP